MKHLRKEKMKAQEIKLKHIYYVDYEPTQKGEFGKKHLAVVLKKNHDKITFVTIPLTSKEKGMGINKISLGKLENLPENLRDKETYAVCDQIRTVSSNRFYKLKDNGIYIDVKVPDDKFALLFESIVNDLMHNLNADEKAAIYKKLYIGIVVNKFRQCYNMFRKSLLRMVGT